VPLEEGPGRAQPEGRRQSRWPLPVGSPGPVAARGRAVKPVAIILVTVTVTRTVADVMIFAESLTTTSGMFHTSRLMNKFCQKMVLLQCWNDSVGFAEALTAAPTVTG
jgi:hypothetical protein